MSETGGRRMTDWERKLFSYYQKPQWGRLLLGITILAGLPVLGYFVDSWFGLIFMFSLEVLVLAYLAESYYEKYQMSREKLQKLENKQKELKDQESNRPS